MRTTHIVGILIFCIVRLGAAAKLGPIPEGFYKIVNVADGTVLTATRKPGHTGSRPWQVITASWLGADEQEWKIKTRIIDGEAYDIIRNEKIKDNEVTKEINEDKKVNKNAFVQIYWNLMTIGAGRTAGYELNNGMFCLKGNGLGKEISYVNCLDSDEDNIDNSYLWRFDFLYDIPPSGPAVQFKRNSF